jgi:exosortase A
VGTWTADGQQLPADARGRVEPLNPEESQVSATSPAALPPAEPRLAGSAWTPAVVLLALGTVALGIVFSREVMAALRIWDTNEAYNHCWLVLPIAFYLFWVRRHRLEGLRPQPMPVLALLALPVGLAWLVAERLGIMEGRQLTALAMFYVLCLAVLGWRVCKAFAAPLVYLVFLVPFGAFTVPMLQSITAWMIEIGLNLIGIPNYVDDLIIETPAGTFLVAEACAGLRFLIATIAFGALYAFTMFRSPGRRIAVMVLAVVVPIFANGIRALGIVVMGSVLGSAEAAAADHVLYGWIFFSIVLLLLIAAGLPFRQDGARPPAVPLPARPIPLPRMAVLAGSGVVAVALAAAGPLAAGVLDKAGAREPERSAVVLPGLDGCEPSADAAALICGDLLVRAEAVVFPEQATWGVVSAERGRVAGLDDQDILFSVAVPNGGTWRVRQSKDNGRTVAIGLWLNGRPAGGGVRSRAEQALNSIGYGGGTPVLVAISITPEQAGAPLHALRQRALLESLLQARGAQISAEAAVRSSNGKGRAQRTVARGDGTPG